MNNGEKWDVKLEKSWNYAFNGQKESNDELVDKPTIKYYQQQFRFIYHDQVITSEDLGNITYGYLGTALGIDPILLQTAGIIVGSDKLDEDDAAMTFFGISLYYALE